MTNVAREYRVATGIPGRDRANVTNVAVRTINVIFPNILDISHEAMDLTIHSLSTSQTYEERLIAAMHILSSYWLIAMFPTCCDWLKMIITKLKGVVSPILVSL